MDDDDFTLLAGTGSAAEQVEKETSEKVLEAAATLGSLRARILLAARVGATRLIDNADVVISVAGGARHE